MLVLFTIDKFSVILVSFTIDKLSDFSLFMVVF